jgi:dolichyl-phosphate beta-glucosyltransferase
MATPSDIKLSVIIPAYNEELRLPDTLAKSIEYLAAQNYGSEIIIVNDGSSDGTERVVDEKANSGIPIRLLRHPDGANHGKGAAVRAGMLAASGDYRLFMDADNSTTLDHISRFWPHFEEGCDLVIGSRALKDSVICMHQNKAKEIAGRLGNLFIQKMAVPGIQDTQAGFKMATAKAAELIFPRLTIERWGYDIEMLAIAEAHGCKICEVPITWNNAEGSKVSFGSYFEVLSEVWTIRKNLMAGKYR